MDAPTPQASPRRWIQAKPLVWQLNEKLVETSGLGLCVTGIPCARGRGDHPAATKQRGDVVDGVPTGERLTDTWVDHLVAELRPLPRRVLDASKLLECWRHLPSIDPVRLRCDIDDVIDPSL